MESNFTLNDALILAIVVVVIILYRQLPAIKERRHKHNLNRAYNDYQTRLAEQREKQKYDQQRRQMVKI